ncbi:Putative Preprotein translocase, SecG subunit [Clostridium chauvoei JF4335]|nr:Putative Preprotein translocase, SecG subunit [Clostridium chauvoei JF4335]
MGGVTMKNFLFVLEGILGLIVIVSILLQPSKADALNGLIQGSKTETFFSKNKTRTKEAMLLKLTVIAMAAFAINTIVLNLV